MNAAASVAAVVQPAPAPVPTPAGVRQRMPLHPGRFLQRQFLEPLGLTQSEAARRLGVSRRRVHELVHGKRAMSPDTAIRCAQAFGLSTADWLAMQSEWDAWSRWQEIRHQQVSPPAPMRAGLHGVPTTPAGTATGALRPATPAPTPDVAAALAGGD